MKQLLTMMLTTALATSAWADVAEVSLWEPKPGRADELTATALKAKAIAESLGEAAATAALNFGTPRRRSCAKRFGPFCHCRQRSMRNRRRIHASRCDRTLGVWQKLK